MKKIHIIIGFVLLLSVSIISCSKEDDLNSEFFIGQWDQYIERWTQFYIGIDTLYSRDTFEIEFFKDGTSIQRNDTIEILKDWFYRDTPLKQIYFTEVDKVWPGDELYDIVALSKDSQEWQQKYVSNHNIPTVFKYYLKRR